MGVICRDIGLFAFAFCFNPADAAAVRQLNDGVSDFVLFLVPALVAQRSNFVDITNDGLMFRWFKKSVFQSCAAIRAVDNLDSAVEDARDLKEIVYHTLPREPLACSGLRDSRAVVAGIIFEVLEPHGVRHTCAEKNLRCKKHELRRDWRTSAHEVYNSLVDLGYDRCVEWRGEFLAALT